MDELHWQDLRRFLPAGRKDRVVQVGGENIHPARVEAVIAEHPGVAEVTVRLNNTQPEGRLKAFVVPFPGVEIDAATLDQHCRRRLRPVERPRSFTFGASLPKNPLGKLTDWPV
jgi:4-coumarate--CoA ligase